MMYTKIHIHGGEERKCKCLDVFEEQNKTGNDMKVMLLGELALVSYEKWDKCKSSTVTRLTKGRGRKLHTLARGFRLPMASALKSLLFFLHSTAVMMMIIKVTTAMGANTAAIIQRLLGGFLTTAGIKKTRCAALF